MTRPKPGTLPFDIDDVDFVTGATILLVDLYLGRRDVIDRIDALVAFDLSPAAGGKELSKPDLARLYVAISGSDDDPKALAAGRRKGDLVRLLADDIGFFASDDQQEPVKEQVIQIWLFLAVDDTAERMPSLPRQSAIDVDLAAQEQAPTRRPAGTAD